MRTCWYCCCCKPHAYSYGSQNLRRWEAAERDKRRAARESKLISQETANAPNGRTSWYQWSRGEQNGNRTSTNHPHQLLRGTSHDDSATPTRGTSLEEPTTPVPHTPGLSPATPTPIRQDSSPFSDAHAAGSSLGLSASAVMEPTASAPATPKNERPTSRTTLDRPVLQASQSSGVGIPLEPTTAEPFKTPPPRIVIPDEDDSAAASSNRDRGQRRQQQDLDWQDDRERQRDGKWWTEWLCGCREDKREQQVCMLVSVIVLCVLMHTFREVRPIHSSRDVTGACMRENMVFLWDICLVYTRIVVIKSTLHDDCCAAGSRMDYVLAYNMFVYFAGGERCLRGSWLKYRPVTGKCGAVSQTTCADFWDVSMMLGHLPTGRLASQLLRRTRSAVSARNLSSSPYQKMASARSSTLTHRRQHATKANGKTPTYTLSSGSDSDNSHAHHEHEHEHANGNGNGHDHGHSHGLFHSHSHGDHDHSAGNQMIIDALAGKGRSRSRATCAACHVSDPLARTSQATGVVASPLLVCFQTSALPLVKALQAGQYCFSVICAPSRNGRAHANP